MQNEQPTPLRFDALHAPVPTLQLLKQSFTTRYKKAAIILGLFIGGMYLGIMLIALIASGGNWFTLLAVLAFIVLPPVGFIGAWVIQGYFHTLRMLRLMRFAADNHLHFEPFSHANDQPGAIFQLGKDQVIEHKLSGTYTGLDFEIGNFFYMTGGKNNQKRWYGMLRIKLSRRLPNVLLDGKQNNKLHISNMPNFKNNQRLQLEGDFNNYFDLYVPKGYERDALYFMTPELMALLIDHGAKFDIEVIDNYLYIYSDDQFDLDNEVALRAIFDLIPLMGKEFEENTQRYADATIGDRAANMVAVPGRRLKRTFSWVGIIFVIIYLIFLFAPKN
jgi:hypothetical protein